MTNKRAKIYILEVCQKQTKHYNYTLYYGTQPQTSDQEHSSIDTLMYDFVCILPLFISYEYFGIINNKSLHWSNCEFIDDQNIWKIMFYRSTSDRLYIFCLQ